MGRNVPPSANWTYLNKINLRFYILYKTGLYCGVQFNIGGPPVPKGPRPFTTYEVMK